MKHSLRYLLSSFGVVLGIALLFSAFDPAARQAFAQSFGLSGAMQAGAPAAPSISPQIDPFSGLYFGVGRVGTARHEESGVSSNFVPAVSACGTGALAAGSTDTAGEFTATGSTGCTLTFGTAYAAAPSCVVTEETVNTATRTTTVSTTSIVIASGTSGSKYSYYCKAKSGG